MDNNEIIFAVIFITLILMVLVSGIAISFFVSIRQNMKQKIVLKQVELDYQKELRFAEAEVSETVRTNIGRDLHDNIGQMLTYLRLQMENKMLDHPDYALQLEPMQSTLSDISYQLRMLSRSLNTDFIKDQSFQEILRMEAERIGQLKHIEVVWNDDSIPPQLDKDAQLISFRIFQEIVNNTLKHSGATRLVIDLQGAQGFYLRVCDNGKGFDLVEKGGQSNGIRNIYKRAELAGLSCEIRTAHGKGCEAILGTVDAGGRSQEQSKKPEHAKD